MGLCLCVCFCLLDDFVLCVCIDMCVVSAIVYACLFIYDYLCVIDNFNILSLCVGLLLYNCTMLFASPHCALCKWIEKY